MRALLPSVVFSGLDLLYPPHCALCRQQIEPFHGEPLLCDACRNRLLAGAIFRCPRCGGSTPQPVPLGQRCGHCRTSRLHFTRTVAMGVYQAELQQAVLEMKRPHSAALGIAMAELFCAARGGEIEALQADLVAPLPMHWWRRCLRGINSPEIVAEAVSRRLRRPLLTRLLRRRARPPQGSLTPYRRRLNLRGAMSVRSRRSLAGLRVLLVDDVLTTGATCSEAARVLRKAGAADVVVAVLARGEGE